MPVLTSIFYRYADQVIAVSEAVATDLEKRKVPRNKIRVRYNPLDIAHILTEGEKPVEHKWFIDKSIPVILSAGRLVKQKSFETLLAAFKIVLTQIDARLVILGEGEERSTLENYARQLGIQQKVDLPGFDLNPFRYMKRADVFVLPSIFEGLSGVILQAMVFGKPIVATNCTGGNREILENGKWGALVPVNDTKRMAEAIIDALNGRLPDPSPRIIDFSKDRIIQQYLDLMELG